MNDIDCHFCSHDGGLILVSNSVLRVIAPEEPDFPGLIRVVWHAHTKEMTDLEQEHRHALMQVVFQIEALIREVLNPHKINLACFGNFVPHLHWHIIPRWTDDAFFPESIWGKQLREMPQELLAERHKQAQDLFAAIKGFDFRSKYYA